MRRDLSPNTFQENQESLFRRWKAHLGTRFFADGPVNIQSYCTAPRRIVFVLKEVNVDPDEAEWSLAQFLAEKGGCGKTWNMVTYWTLGLAELPKYTPWARLPDADADIRKRVLQGVAIVNLNKTGGGATSDDTEIRAAARHSRAELVEQLEHLSPDIVVCAGTGDALAEALGLDAPRWNKWGDGDRVWTLNQPGFPPLVWCYHPQARVKDVTHEVMYEDVLGAARSLLFPATATNSGTESARHSEAKAGRDCSQSSPMPPGRADGEDAVCELDPPVDAPVVPRGRLLRDASAVASPGRARLVCVSGRRFDQPRCCCCCMEATDRFDDFHYRRTTGVRVRRTDTWTLRFPWCALCASHAARAHAALAVAWIASFVLGVVALGVVAWWIGHLDGAAVAATATGALVVGWALGHALCAMIRLRPTCATVGRAVVLTSMHGPEWRIHFTNGAFAAAFCERNEHKLVP